MQLPMPSSRGHRRNALLSILLLLGLALVPQIALAEDYYQAEAQADDIEAGDDDDYIDLTDANFDGMAMMPVSCVNYMNGHMIKFEMFENNNNFQCHSNTVGTFVVSISHFMRAYFNYQSLLQGANFRLPSDAGYLNCVLLQQTAYSEQKLYAKIGLERETYTSTKLRIHVYTDKQCSVDFDDGQTENQRTRHGYEIDGYYFNAKVSFRPSFYSCASCKPEQIADRFSKQGTFWYDDDVAANGGQMYKYFDDWLDDYFLNDDAYFVVQQYVNNEVKYYKEDDDDFYTADDDGRRLGQVEAGEGKQIEVRQFRAAEGELEKFEQQFKNEQRELYYDDAAAAADDAAAAIDDSVLSWNMCSKIYKYGVYCDEECRALDTFRIDEWSTSDIFLLGIMCVFMAGMMGLIFAKRVKVYEKAAIYADESEAPDLGLRPLPMAVIFVLVLVVVIVMAVMRLVNETLVVAVVSCILLFIYMLKLTLFESKNPAIGGNKKHQIDYSYGGNTLFNLT